MDRVLTASQLLEVWEQGRARTPAQRARALLALAQPAVPAAELAGFGIGRRDRELLGLRERLFGPRLTGAAQCPDCGLDIELDFAVADIRAPEATPPESALTLADAGYELRFRLPTCGDLEALELGGDPAGRKTALLERCVTEARWHGEIAPVHALPASLTTALTGRMADLDPQGDIRLALTCPRCARQWQAPFDIVSYLWSELQAWALDLLRDIHELARAYGWREADILNLSAWRRQAYLEMIRQ